jgi:hypothetical protein
LKENEDNGKLKDKDEFNELELTPQSMAAQERALEIAKISSFVFSF